MCPETGITSSYESLAVGAGPLQEPLSHLLPPNFYYGFHTFLTPGLGHVGGALLDRDTSWGRETWAQVGLMQLCSQYRP